MFVADEIPPELRRVVEFLNAQMDPAEVLAVEIRQFLGVGLPTLVATVVGQTAKPVPGDGKTWDERAFLHELEARRGSRDAVMAQAVLRRATEHGLMML